MAIKSAVTRRIQRLHSRARRDDCHSDYQVIRVIRDGDRRRRGERLAKRPPRDEKAAKVRNRDGDVRYAPVAARERVKVRGELIPRASSSPSSSAPIRQADPEVESNSHGSASEEGQLLVTRIPRENLQVSRLRRGREFPSLGCFAFPEVGTRFCVEPSTRRRTISAKIAPGH
jgi:hypothetical protein